MSVNGNAAVLLYVEDEMLTREVVGAALRDAGFHVIVATSGDEAVRLLENQSSAFCGLVTDVNLGEGVDGWHVARRIREMLRNVAVIYVSGASSHQFVSQGVPLSIMIDKPFEPSQIISALSSLLNFGEADGADSTR